MGNSPALSECEWLIMSRLWRQSPLTAAEIVDTEMDGKTLPNTTARTLLRRLVAKKAVGFTVDNQNANLYHYFPIISEQDCIRKENKHFLELYYHNNTSNLFAAFMDDASLSDEEVAKLRKMLEEKYGTD
jgi:BlaI family penicillinase repressor